MKKLEIMEPTKLLISNISVIIIIIIILSM